MTGERRRARPGAGLLEAVAALALATLLAALVAGSLRAGAAAARHAGATADAADAMRISALLLASELRTLEPAADLAGSAADSVRLRAFRGVGIVCDTVGGHVVRYRGLRDPDPAKDSLLVIGGGGERIVALASAQSAAGCAAAPGERLFRVAGSSALPAGADLVVVFESGAYHLSGGALRYRRGRGGRQPITPDVLADGATSFQVPVGPDPLAPRGIAVTLSPAAVQRGAAGPAPPLATLRVDIGFLNRPASPDTLPERP